MKNEEPEATMFTFRCLYKDLKGEEHKNEILISDIQTFKCTKKLFVLVSITVLVKFHILLVKSNM